MHDSMEIPLNADDHLASLGYESELTRNRSTFQIAFMSFVLAAIPYGLTTTFVYPLTAGGSTDVIWGWLTISVIVASVAASLGEITSVFPTAGGVYYQTYMLSSPAYRRILAWICGWCSVLGQIIITLAVNFGTTLFLIECINIFRDADGNGIFQATTYQYFLIFLALTLICNIVCATGNKWLPIIDTFAIAWTFVGVICFIVTILVLARGGRRSAEFVFTDFTPRSNWAPGWSWMIGLLQAAYTTSSTGMIINMAEEVRDPAVQIPKAMLWTILLNTITGFVWLIPIMFVLPQDVDALLKSPQPVPLIVHAAVGSPGGAFALMIPIIVLALICAIGCTTAASRCIWSFARDGAIPGFQLWSRVNRKFDVPLNAMMLSMGVQILLGMIYFGSSTAFNAFSGVGVIFLTISYGIPISVSLFAGRKLIKNARFHLGTVGVICNIIAVAWTIIAVPLFSMPTVLPVTAQSVNYAPVVFVGMMTISAVWYVVYGRKHYVGPPATTDPGSDAAERSSSTEKREHA